MFSNQAAFSGPMQCYKCVSSRSQCDVPEQLLAEALLKKVCSENHFILTQKDCSENDATKYKINVYLKKRISIFASKTILQLNTDNNPNCRPPLIRNQSSWVKTPMIQMFLHTAHCTGATPSKWGRVGQRTWGGRTTHWCQPQWAGE